MRPWLARQGDLVLMSYDRQRQHTVLEIRLDLDAFGVDPDEDTGWDGSDGWGGSSGGGAGDDTGGDDDDSDARSGGCGGCAVPGPAPLGLFTVAGLLAGQLDFLVAQEYSLVTHKYTIAGHFGVIVVWFWDHAGAISASFCCHCAIIPESFRHHSGVILA